MFKFLNDKPIFLQIVEDILTKIFREEFELGDKLPSVRELAIMYTVNPNTIQKVVGELVVRGVVEIERGKGTFVTKDNQLIKKLKANVIENEVGIFINKLLKMGLKKNEIIDVVKVGDLYDWNPKFRKNIF